MTKQPIGCARPVGPSVDAPPEEQPTNQAKEKKMSFARVGAPAPDFTAPAYYQGGFTSVSLSQFKGKWVVLCFYPGDFTFV